MAIRKVKMVIWNLAGALLIAVLISIWMVATQVNKIVNTDFFGVAIQGYDTVAYFTEGQAREGDRQFKVIWQDASWHFANAEHRDLFAANPELYAPQYGGFCASYIAEGGIAKIDPEAWVIVDGKLYLSWSKEGGKEFAQKDTTEKIRRADEAWAKRQKRG